MGTFAKPAKFTVVFLFLYRRAGRTLRTPFTHPFVIGVVLFLHAAACGGGGSEKPDLGLVVPDGWKLFEETGIRGAVPKDWDVVAITKEGLVRSDNPDLSIKTETIQSFQSHLVRGNLRQAIVVNLAYEPEFTTNVSLLGCVSSQLAFGGKVLQYYAERGYKATTIDTLQLSGRRGDLVKVQLREDFDTYTLAPNWGSCYLLVTFTTRAGDTRWLPAFRQFVELLRVDVSALSE